MSWATRGAPHAFQGLLTVAIFMGVAVKSAHSDHRPHVL